MKPFFACIVLLFITPLFLPSSWAGKEDNKNIILKKTFSKKVNQQNRKGELFWKKKSSKVRHKDAINAYLRKGRRHAFSE